MKTLLKVFYHILEVYYDQPLQNRLIVLAADDDVVWQRITRCVVEKLASELYGRN
ncbi:MAG: hypothetical protein UT22_C0033G0012 [Parcubacteria group bacterium GW2011_GWC2_39_11]|nr:MAG: hypothetical protein UT22_C0033G0012 [Parcubacteria group bacterium GW2011_GWC2_39_11]